jgi:hypothetical protein
MFPPSQRVCSCAIADCVDTGAFPLPHYRRLEAAVEEEQGVAVAVVEAPAVATEEVQAATLASAALELPAALKAVLESVEALSWEARVAAAGAVMLLVLLCVRAAVALSYASVSKPAPVQELTKIAIVDSPSKASRRSNFLSSESLVKMDKGSSKR